MTLKKSWFPLSVRITNLLNSSLEDYSIHIVTSLLTRSISLDSILYKAIQIFLGYEIDVYPDSKIFYMFPL